jgi:hypothetical protein
LKIALFPEVPGGSLNQPEMIEIPPSNGFIEYQKLNIDVIQGTELWRFPTISTQYILKPPELYLSPSVVTT